VGLTQRLSETSDLEIRAGARFAEGEFSDTEVDPYLLFNWNREYDRGSTSVTATWDETTILAEIGPVDAKTIRAGWNHNFTEAFEFGGTASYADVSSVTYDANNASLAVFGNYRFNRYVYLSARYRFSVQDIDRSLSISDRRINRNVVSIAITFTRPRPGTGSTM
jgi:outer membrane autotransporter protein